MVEESDLKIEKKLQRRSKDLYALYSELKRKMLNHEYLFTMHAFPGGNDHGPNHIRRVLGYVDKLLDVRHLPHSMAAEQLGVSVSTLKRWRRGVRKTSLDSA